MTLCPSACLHLEKPLSDLSVSLPCLCGGREGRGREREIISAFTQLVVIRRQGPGALLAAAPKATAGPRVAAEWALDTLSESGLASQLLPLGSPLQSPRGMPRPSSSPQLLLPGAISGARPRFSAPSTAGWGYVRPSGPVLVPLARGACSPGDPSPDPEEQGSRPWPAAFLGDPPLRSLVDAGPSGTETPASLGNGVLTPGSWSSHNSSSICLSPNNRFRNIGEPPI